MGEPGTALGRLLRARRDALQPQDVGLRGEPGRRVPGLRRQEVADSAGISGEYYLRLEQGRDRQPSPPVLLALARALRLDADGTEYLFRLAGQALPSVRSPSEPAGTDSGVASEGVSGADGVTTLLTQWTSAPAYVTNRVQDVIAVNPLGRSFIPLSLPPGANMVEAIVDGALAAGGERQEFWDQAVRHVVAAMRYCADQDDQRLQLLVAKLSTRSRLFRQVWASHEAHPQRSGVVPVQVEPFGYIDFRWQTLQVPDQDQFLTTFFGDPGSPAAAAIEFLRAKLVLAETVAKAAHVDQPRNSDTTAGPSPAGS